MKARVILFAVAGMLLVRADDQGGIDVVKESTAACTKLVDAGHKEATEHGLKTDKSVDDLAMIACQYGFGEGLIAAQKHLMKGKP